MPTWGPVSQAKVKAELERELGKAMLSSFFC